LKVADTEQFKRIAKGERVEAIYTEALQLTVGDTAQPAAS
jgi:hypothetical protein